MDKNGCFFLNAETQLRFTSNTNMGADLVVCGGNKKFLKYILNMNNFKR